MAPRFLTALSSCTVPVGSPALRTSLLPLLLATIACIALAGCTRGTLGFTTLPDGSMVPMSAKNMRIKHEMELARDLEARLGEGWAVGVAIDRTPYHEPDMDLGDPGFWYEQARVAIRVVGDGDGDTPSLSTDTMEALVYDFMVVRTDDTDQLQVHATVIEGDPAMQRQVWQDMGSERADQLQVSDGREEEDAGSEGPQAVAASNDEATSYVVQEGDTLAIISTVFYGSPKHWRRISSANPAIVPDRPLEAGTELVIPPAQEP